MKYGMNDLVWYKGEDWVVKGKREAGLLLMRFDETPDKKIIQEGVSPDDLEPVLDDAGNPRRFKLCETEVAGYVLPDNRKRGRKMPIVADTNDITLTVKSKTLWGNNTNDPDDLYEPWEDIQLDEPEVYEGADAIKAMYDAIEKNMYQFDAGVSEIETPYEVTITHQGRSVDVELEDWDGYSVEQLISIWENR